MKKILLSAFFGAVSFAGMASTQWTLNRVTTEGIPVVETFKVDTLRHEKVGPGTFYTLLYLKCNENATHMRTHFLTMDMKGHDDVEFRMELANDSLLTMERVSDVAKRKTAPNNYYFAGVNADFYITWDPYKGNPNMACYMDGQIAMYDMDEPLRYGHFFMDYNKNMWCDFPFETFYMTKADGTKMELNHINHDLNDNQLVLYNEKGGHWTKTKDATEIRVKLVEGEKWRINSPFKLQVIGSPVVGGNMQVMPGEAVLSAKGSRVADVEALKDGEILTMLFETHLENYNIEPDLKEVSGGDVIILKAGKTMYEAGRFINPRDAYNPRTMFGYTEDRSKMIWGLIDGRSSRSSGSTYTQGAEIMKYAGCYDAVNVDGGGSSGMYIQNLGVVNDPSDGHERAVSNGLYAVLKAPEDNNVAEIRFVDWAMEFPKYGIYTPKFYGYNKYGMLIDTDVQGVTLSCDAKIGEVINDGATFYGTGDGCAALTANYNGLSASIPVTVAESDKVNFRLSNVLIDNVREYPIEVNSVVGEKEMPISPTALSWSSDNSDIASISADGLLKGISDGVAVVSGKVGNFVGNLKVNVEVPTGEFMPVYREFPTDATIKQVGGTDIKISEFEKGFKLNYTGKSGRGQYIEISKTYPIWSLPEKLRIRINPGDAKISKITATAKNALGVIESVWTATESSVPNNEETEYYFNVKDWCDPTDIAVYPITLEKLRFAMSGSVAGKAYEIRVPKFEAIYSQQQGGIVENTVSSGLKVYSSNGEIVVDADSETVIYVSSIDGRCATYKVPSGETRLSGFSNGVYIVNGMKIILLR